MMKKTWLKRFSEERENVIDNMKSEKSHHQAAHQSVSENHGLLNIDKK